MIRIFFIKAFIVSLPVLILLGIYVVKDPFKVLGSYSLYYISGKPAGVALNRDYVSTEVYLKNHLANRYNAFIFGNSRTIAYRAAEWKKHIAPNSRIFHFDASGESLYGIEKKIQLAAHYNDTISEALFIIDASVLRETKNSAGILFMKHPALSRQNTFSFNAEFLKSFFSADFLPAYLDFLCSGKIKPYMTKSMILDSRPFTYDPRTNELTLDMTDTLIERNPDLYYHQKAGAFYRRDSVPEQSEPVINKEAIMLMNNIRSVLSKYHTNYRIVVSPLYDQQRINPEDLRLLENIFGKGNVFDFSGKNAMTDDIHNYYEASHYRPRLGKLIMDDIY